MDPLTVLIWLGAIVAALVVLSIVAVLVVVAYAASLGLRRMRDEDEKDDEQDIYVGKAER